MRLDEIAGEMKEMMMMHVGRCARGMELVLRNDESNGNEVKKAALVEG